MEIAERKLKEDYMRKFFTSLLAFMMFFTSFAMNTSTVVAEETIEWESISATKGSIKEVIEDATRYWELSSSAGNGNKNNPAIFTRSTDWKTNEKEANLTFDFIAKNSADNNRFGIYLFYTDMDNFVSVGYDKGGWFWEYKVNGNGEWMKETRVAAPQLDSLNSLEISLKDNLLHAWNTDADGNKTHLFTKGIDANIIDQLHEKSDDIVIKLGTFSGTLSKIMIKAENQENIVIPEPDFERPILDYYEEYELVEDFESMTEEDLKDMFKVERGNVETSLVTEDGNTSVRLDFKDTGKNLIVFRETPLLENFELEADIVVEKAEGAADMKRLALLGRVMSEDEYGYAAMGDKINEYFTENFGQKPGYSNTVTGTPIEANKTYTWKMVMNQKNITLFINGQEIISSERSGLATGIGAFGFFKDRGRGSVLIDNIRVTKIAPERPTAPEHDDADLVELKSDEMIVRVDETFPRVYDYTLVSSNNVMSGQPTKIDQVLINNIAIIPEVSAQKVSDSKMEYTLDLKDEANSIDARLTAEIEVIKNTLAFNIREVKNNNPVQETNAQIIRTIEIPNHSLVSVNSEETNANVYGARMSTNTTVNGDKLTLVDDQLRTFNDSYMYAVISNDKLSASMHSNSQHSSGGGANDFTRLNARVKEFEDFNSLGLSSSPWIYHRDVMYDENTLELPEARIVITEDANDDGIVDWQDGAIAFRDIMYSPIGAEDVKDLVAYRIAMNFGSHAQNPFLMTLDGIKKINLHTDGLGQSILLKGYGSEGHDSGHLNYADIGRRMGGAEEFIYLLDESVDYGAKIGIHVNASETYPESKYFSEKILRKSADGSYNYGWNWIDQGINIDASIDLANGRRARFEDLKDLIGDNMDWVYVDVWGNGQSGDNNAWMSHQLAKEINDQGWRLGGEWGYAFEPDSTFQHWAADLTYGGYTLKGINSTLTRFIFNHQRDAWPAHYPNYGGAAESPLLGGYNMKDFEGWQGRNDYNGYIVNLFENNLSTKFIQHYTVNKWVEGTPVNMTNSSGVNFNWTPEMEVELVNEAGDVVHIERGSNDFKNDLAGYRHRTMTLNNRKVLDGETYLLPWNWDENGNDITSVDEQKLYHFNKAGGQTTWEIPADWNASTVEFYQLTETGNKLVETVSVNNNTVVLNAKANTPYVIYKGKQAEKAVTYGEGAHIVDPGFNTQNLEAWDVVGENAEVMKSQATNDMLRIEDNTDTTSVSQVLTDLEPNEKYVAYVGVDNRSDAKAILELDVAGEIVSNYTHKSIAKNYVKAYAHNTNSSTVDKNSYFQNMFVYFTAPESGTVTLSLIREAGEGATYFDDVRITKNDGNPQLEGHVFFQDFENNAQGIYPFVVGNIEGVEDNRTHLSEKHEPYTQRGWNNKQISDVIDGDWSLKTNGLTQRNRLVYQTIPQNLRFEAGVTYTVSFDYELGSNETYALIIGDGEINGSEEMIPLSATLFEDGPQTYEFELTGAASGQSWFGIYSTSTAPNLQGSADKEANFRSYKDIILDNVRVESPYEVILENNDLGVSIEGLSSFLKEDDVLEAAENATLKAELEANNDELDLDVYDINVKRDGEDLQLDHSVTLNIPTRTSTRFLFSKAADSVVDVKRLDTDGNWIDVNFTQEDDVISIETSALGSFAVNYGKKQIVVDKTQLKAMLDKIEAFDESKYTEASWNKLLTVLTKAKAIYSDAAIDQVSVDDVVVELEAAIDALVEKDTTTINYDKLQYAVELIKQLHKEDYTDETWTQLMGILAQAEELLANKDAVDQEAVDALTAQLYEAREKLERVKEDPVVPTDPTTPTKPKDPNTGISQGSIITYLSIIAVAAVAIVLIKKRKRI